MGCGKPVERGRIIGYDTETGKPIYFTPLHCKDCGEEFSRRVEAQQRNSYNIELEKIRNMRSADMLDTGTAEFMKKDLRKRYNIKEIWE